MTKKRTWGTILTFIATVIVLFAFCGLTVLADDPEGSTPEIFEGLVRNWLMTH